MSKGQGGVENGHINLNYDMYIAHLNPFITQSLYIYSLNAASVQCTVEIATNWLTEQTF